MSTLQRRVLVWALGLWVAGAWSAARAANNDYRYPRDDFGQRIANVKGDVAVWWCEAGWKVAQDRAAPEETAPAATLSAAKNDFQGVQVVVAPTRNLCGLQAVVSDLVNAEGEKIAARDIEVLRAYYHHVKRPTDRSCKANWWPDALPPFAAPLDVAAGKNQPVWVLVHVPKDAAAGDYRGALKLKAQGWSATVPLRLHVWDFALPETNHLETGFGLAEGAIAEYQGLKSEADKRRVWDMYMQSMADHRISPYDPVPFDPIEKKFVYNAQPPRVEYDFAAFDKAFARAIKKYHFTNIRFRFDGIGGSLRGPNGKVYEDGNPTFDALFSSEVKQFEDHFREKGWLQMPYIYWTDEPKPEKYPFVQAGMDRLKKYAPDLQTLITLNMPDKQLTLDKSIDIWCPVTHRYNQERAEGHQARGDRYWWYICTGPKAPYCTLFLDHPATELRVWLWQTWQHNISGVLVWKINFWKGHGQKNQNPYEDPMSYSGESWYPYWGNGDGRFVYPPLQAATPAAPNAKPVIAPPVSSIRYEMLREGIEDYEFLWLLRDLIGKKRAALSADQVKAYEALLQVPEDITSSMTSFTTDPRPINARRAAIAEAIEQLSQ